MPFRQQKRHRILSPEQKTRDGRIRAAWLGICWPLKSRPVPRGPWDGAARETCPSSPWEPMQGHVRNAVEAAVALGNPHVIAEVRKRVEVYYSILLADALSPIPRDAECVLQLSQSVTREHAEASIARQRLLTQLPSPSMPAIEDAVREETESLHASTRCLNFLNAFLHRNVRPNLTVAR